MNMIFLFRFQSAPLPLHFGFDLHFEGILPKGPFWQDTVDLEVPPGLIKTLLGHQLNNLFKTCRNLLKYIHLGWKWNFVSLHIVLVNQESAFTNTVNYLIALLSHDAWNHSAVTPSSQLKCSFYLHQCPGNKLSVRNEDEGIHITCRKENFNPSPVSLVFPCGSSLWSGYLFFKMFTLLLWKLLGYLQCWASAHQLGFHDYFETLCCKYD